MTETSRSSKKRNMKLVILNPGLRVKFRGKINIIRHLGIYLTNTLLVGIEIYPKYLYRLRDFSYQICLTKRVYGVKCLIVL